MERNHLPADLPHYNLDTPPTPELRTMTALQDPFYWLGEMNKASAVMVVERAIVPAPVGALIARSIKTVIDDGNESDSPRSGDYLQVEAALIEAGGPDVSRVHSGRSRQDISATFGRLFLRDGLLNALDALNNARDDLLTFAAENANAIIPAYTWGVQAQPTSFGHWLGAYATAFARAAQRCRQTYARVNLCPLGSAALGTSSFPIDRERLAELLGFHGVAENSFDATQIGPADLRVEASQVLATSALTVGMLLGDITAQYSHSRPWLTLAQGEQTGTSSIMPQKRNPTGLVRLRALASQVVANTTATSVLAHNVPSGMHDYKLEGPDPALADAARMLGDLAALLKHLRFEPERALEEVNAEYSTTTELADVLQRDCDVPFRAGHHFASELVTFGRTNRLRPDEIPYSQAKRIYCEAAAESSLSPELPLSEKQFRAALSADAMILASKGLGGPQPGEVERMLK
ncbi:MAG: argininosuccinate lyase, partial [Gammaproteobacteria bacterium]